MPNGASVGLTRLFARRLGIHGIRTAEDRLRFGGALTKKGGLLEVIGRAIRIQAILHGARRE